ncbi:MAG: riboflavin synthase [Alphaproteobacteria bacterium]|nr:riboflavin synthase [Alphaproteobacteria bacterium]
MFTGLVQSIGTVLSATHNTHGSLLVILSNLDPKHLQLGASVACNGACMTVVNYQQHMNAFSIEVSPESVSRTTLGNWKEGTRINLESPLAAGDPLGGHITSGHVDGIAKVHQINPRGDHYDLMLDIPKEYLPYVVEKGSLTVDGCSLTVAGIENTLIRIAVIPHTWNHTIIHTYSLETKVNIEVDLLARYVVHALSYLKSDT